MCLLIFQRLQLDLLQGQGRGEPQEGLWTACFQWGLTGCPHYLSFSTWLTCPICSKPAEGCILHWQSSGIRGSGVAGLEAFRRQRDQGSGLGCLAPGPSLGVLHRGRSHHKELRWTSSPVLLPVVLSARRKRPLRPARASLSLRLPMAKDIGRMPHLPPAHQPSTTPCIALRWQSRRMQATPEPSGQLLSSKMSYGRGFHGLPSMLIPSLAMDSTNR